MDRHDLRKLSDSALAEHVLTTEALGSTTHQLAVMTADRDKLMRQLKQTADVLHELLDASKLISDADLTSRDNDKLDVARKNAAEVLAICATYVHK